MNIPTLYVMCGIPGSGKSTWLKNNMISNAIVISRDEIRFSRLKEGESYFAREDAVYEDFIGYINQHLAAGINVVADATHINTGSRSKLLKSITVPCNKIALVMDTPSSICLERNAKREGLERVPDSVIRRMSRQFIYPEEKEGFNEIWTINWK